MLFPLLLWRHNILILDRNLFRFEFALVSLFMKAVRNRLRTFQKTMSFAKSFFGLWV